MVDVVLKQEADSESEMKDAMENYFFQVNKDYDEEEVTRRREEAIEEEIDVEERRVSEEIRRKGELVATWEVRQQKKKSKEKLKEDIRKKVEQYQERFESPNIYLFENPKHLEMDLEAESAEMNVEKKDLFKTLVETAIQKRDELEDSVVIRMALNQILEWERAEELVDDEEKLNYFRNNQEMFDYASR